MAEQTPQPPRKPGVPAKLSTLFSRKMELDGPETVALWASHFQGDVAADHALFVHYAPIVKIVACKMKRRRPHFYRDDLEILISDGALGLLDAIRLTDFGPAGFRRYANRRVASRLHQEVESRHWGGRNSLREERIISDARGCLTAELGRLPDAAELAHRVRGKITNPNLFIEGEREMSPASQLGDGDWTPHVVTIDRPDARAIDAETIRMACRGLDPLDKSILKLMLKGKTPNQIAVKLNLNRERLQDRMAGVLWKCRCNAKLAEYLEADAEPMELGAARDGDGHWRRFPIRFYKPGPPPCRAAG